jgi:hypothetical protein
VVHGGPIDDRKVRGKVAAKAFNDGKVTGCPECVAAGLAPALYGSGVRVSVGLDPEPMAALGFDSEAATGKQVRQLLSDLGEAVAEAGRSIRKTPKQWQTLMEGLQRNPLVLDDPADPAVRLAMIEVWAGCGGFSDLTGLQVVAVLAALRWGLSHPDCRWWEPDVRMGE